MFFRLSLHGAEPPKPASYLRDHRAKQVAATICVARFLYLQGSAQTTMMCEYLLHKLLRVCTSATQKSVQNKMQDFPISWKNRSTVNTVFSRSNECRGHCDAIVLSCALSNEVLQRFADTAREYCPDCPVIGITKNLVDRRIAPDAVALATGGPAALLSALGQSCNQAEHDADIHCAKLPLFKAEPYGEARLDWLTSSSDIKNGVWAHEYKVHRNRREQYQPEGLGAGAAGSLAVPSRPALEIEIQKVTAEEVARMNPDEWYQFLRNKYFRWRYATAEGRYALSLKHLRISTKPASLFYYELRSASSRLRFAQR
jgi:hypothetical protein